MPSDTRAPTPEPLLGSWPLGLIVELGLLSFVGNSVYTSLYYTSKLFRHFRLSEIKKQLSDLIPPGAQPVGQCPATYSEWIDYPRLGCRADAAHVTERARTVTWILFGAGVSAVGLVLVRKARDAGVTFSLPWAPSHPEPSNTSLSSYDRRRGTPGPRPPGPPPHRPEHLRIPWWLEPALTLLAALSVFVFLLIGWKLLTQRGYQEGYGMPKCTPGPFGTPAWVYEYSGRSAQCVDAWWLYLLGFLQMFNAACAAVLNGLAVVLVRKELLHDGWDWL